MAEVRKEKIDKYEISMHVFINISMNLCLYIYRYMGKSIDSEMARSVAMDFGFGKTLKGVTPGIF